MLSGVFEWSVVDYCMNIMIPRLLPNLKSGNVLDIDGQPLGPTQENPYYSGRTVFFNGSYVKDKIEQALEDKTSLEHIVTEKINSMNEWCNYFKKELKLSDRIYIYNGTIGELSRFKGQLKLSDQNKPNLALEITKYLPDEYVEIANGKRITGGRTRSSMMATAADYKVDGVDKKVEAVCLNQTAGKEGFGLLSHMANTRIVEDIIPYFDKEKDCPQLMYRQRNDQGEMVKVEDHAINILNQKLSYAVHKRHEANQEFAYALAS